MFENQKFTAPYIDFVNNNFNQKDHLFLIIVNNINEKVISGENVKKVTKDLKSLFLILIYMYRFKKIFLHGLFIRKVVLILFLQPWLIKKSNWIVWGGDLYEYRIRKVKIKSRIYEFCRRVVIKNFGEITTLTKGDYLLAKKWYNVKGKYYHGVYINPIKIEFLRSLKFSDMKDNKTINIQLGNSASPNNKHFEGLNLLKKFKNENIKIYCPLSYGDSKYAQTVKNYGNEILGERFKPLLDFLNPQEYAKFLATIDIAVFNNDRQQGLGNIFALLYLGKKVYIRDDISTWEYLKKQLNLKIYNYKDIKRQDYLEFINVEESETNKEKVRLLFDQNYIKKVWEKIIN